jgi:hypothetical protein
MMSAAPRDRVRDRDRNEAVECAIAEQSVGIGSLKDLNRENVDPRAEAKGRPGCSRLCPLRQRAEPIAHAVADWCRFFRPGTLVIDPGPPWQRACIDSLNGRLNDEPVNGHVFDPWPYYSIARSEGDHRRLPSRLQRERTQSIHGGLTPVELVGAWLHRREHHLA